MGSCPNCGRECPAEFRFCPYCAAALDRSPAQQVRKTVSVVFCDVTGSTGLGERLDPEALRQVMTRYFQTASAALTRHGGTVEKFIGDAVVAVFGVPELHEDDALRAVRAAAELRDQLDALNKELERDLGVVIEIRVGVHTGEVMAGDASSGHALISGDTGNVAARLQQAAAPGEVLISEMTRRLVRDAVTVQPAGELSLRGRREPVPAFRLLSVISGAVGHGRRVESPMVGRDAELSSLRQIFRNAVRDRICHLCTVFGAAGVGKSRLVDEFVASLVDVRVLRGRCLSYGEGITFWPLTEMLRGVAPADVAGQPDLRVLLGGHRDAEEVVRALDRLVGSAGAPLLSLEDGFWAVRRFCELLARDQPLVVVIDDLQWAEPPFLDLVDHVTDLTRGAPVLLICLARPELLESRPGWGGGKLNATALQLRPLATDAAARLLANLLGGAPLPPEVTDRILAAAEGTPLFVEELLGMLGDDGLLERADGRWLPSRELSSLQVPGNVQALLAARLDRCAPAERVVLGHAAVVGQVFYRAVVEELTPADERARVPATLTGLVRRGLVEPDEGDLPGMAAYRFHHILFRDVVYDSLSRTERADLHARVADWLGGHMPAGEAEEFVGYHLEQAHLNLVAVRPGAPRAAELAGRAAGALSVAGARAEARLDLPGAAGLLGRALRLTDGADPGMWRRAGEVALQLGHVTAAKQAFTRLLDLAGSDDRARTYARLRLAECRLHSDPEGGRVAALREIDAELPAIEALADNRSLYAAHELRGRAYWLVLQYGAARRELLSAAECARSAGDVLAELHTLSLGLVAAFYGPLPVPAFLEEIESLRGRFGSSRSFTPWLTTNTAGALMLLGRLAEARAQAVAAEEAAGQLGLGWKWAACTETRWRVEDAAGAHAAAEQAAARGYQRWQQMGQTSHASTWVVLRARSCLRLGRFEDAERYAEECRRTSASDDLINQWLWRSVVAELCVRRCDLTAAERFSREAVDFLRDSDDFQVGDALCDLAGVLVAAGKTEQARSAFDRARRIYQRKQATGLLARADRWWTALGAGE